jgi:hypothetical protein
VDEIHSPPVEIVHPTASDRVRESAPMRIFNLDRAEPRAVAVYPDSVKLGVFAGGDRDRVMVRRSSDVPYFDGET